MQEKDKREYAAARGNIYRLLSTAFSKELTPETMKIFRGEEMAEILKDFGDGLGNEFYRRDEKELLSALAEEYAALFILPGGVNPTESVARSGLYMQAYAGQALKFYKKCGFVLADDFKGFPDHIGTELELMSHLSKNEAAAYEKNFGDEIKKWIEFQKEFLQNHLSQWALTFAKDVAAYARQSFYREMAKLLYEFMLSEMGELAIEGDNIKI